MGFFLYSILPSTRYRVLGTGHWVLGTGLKILLYRVQVTGYRLLGTGYIKRIFLVRLFFFFEKCFAREKILVRSKYPFSCEAFTRIFSLLRTYCLFFIRFFFTRKKLRIFLFHLKYRVQGRKYTLFQQVGKKKIKKNKQFIKKIK